MIKALKAREARTFGEEIGFPVTEGDGRTYYAADTEAGELWEFDSKKERDEFVIALQEVAKEAEACM